MAVDTNDYNLLGVQQYTLVAHDAMYGNGPYILSVFNLELTCPPLPTSIFTVYTPGASHYGYPSL